MPTISATWLVAVFTILPSLFLPGCITYILLSQFTHTPQYLAIIASLLAFPLSILLRNLLQVLSIRQRAFKLGAQVPPSVFDPTFVGYYTVKKMKEEDDGHPGQAVGELFEKYGYTFNIQRLGGEIMTLTAEPDHLKAILATQFDNFVLGEARYRAFHPFLGDGVFTSDGEMWKMHRGATRPYFSKDRISHLENFDKHAELAITIAHERLRQDVPIDFQDLAGRFTLDSATQFLFGYDVQSLDAGLPFPPNTHVSSSLTNPINPEHPSNTFVNAFTKGLLLTGQRGSRGKFAPLFDIFGNPQVEMRNIIDPYVDIIIRKVKERKDVGKVDEQDDTLLEHLVGFIEDPKILRDEILNLLVAGRDTTAALLTFSVYALTQYPGVLARLRQEVLEQVGGIGEKPNVEVIKGMKYLRAFLNETLRLYPIVPANSRQAKSDTVIKSSNPYVPDYFVAGGSRVGYNVLLMQRRKDLWGEDAEVFDPDRFMDWRLSKYLTPNPFIFLPFNAGPRICLGQQFAYTEASYFLIKLLQHFDTFELTLPNPAHGAQGLPGRMGQEKIAFGEHLTLYAQGGLWVKMKDSTSVSD
ncbi:cytochrome P450 [Flagelloscypha sp. PMI_526]|nr:cytochrome P450 [Flagelloscypha sp. PMI_526]